MKLLSYHFANMSNLPEINCVVTFISFFFYSKKFNTGRLPIVKFNHHFCFSMVKTIYTFSSINLFFLLFFIFVIQINAIWLFLHSSFKLFFSGLVCWFVLIEWKCFRLKCWIISSLNSVGEKRFLNVSSLKIVVNVLM